MGRKTGSAEANTYGLPKGDRIRKAVKEAFRDQRRQMLGVIGGKLKGKQMAPLPELPDAWPPFRLGTLAMSERIVPLITAHWDEAGKAFQARHDLDPDRWNVVNPRLKEKIEGAALEFAESTNRTTSLALDEALRRTKAELVAGLFDKGESIPKLTKRINAIFDGAETYRARRIAQSEASRAVHAATEQAAIDSGIVVGWEWLMSSDACPLCHMVGTDARFIKLGQPFAIIGDNPTYRNIKHPPLHPHCNCTMLEVTSPEWGGPKEVAWAETLDQPKPPPDPKPDPKPPKRVREKPTPPPKPEPEAVQEAAPPAPPIDLATAPIADALKAYTLGDEKLAKVIEYGEMKRVYRNTKLQIEGLKNSAKSLAEGVRYFNDAIPVAERSPEQIRFASEMEENLKAIQADMKAAKAKLAKLPDPGAYIASVLKPIRDPVRIRATDRDEKASVQGKPTKEGEAFLSGIVAKGRGEKDSDLLLTLYHKLPPRGRAYASGYTIALAKSDDAGTVIHEWGHRIEGEIPGVQKRANEFLDHRLKGETPQQLNKVLHGSSYDDHEMGAKDDFEKAFGASHAWYVGKRYKHGATEIVSMGIEKLYREPLGFATDDPEYCKFILGILDGSLR
jgi:hypothetical protein